MSVLTLVLAAVAGLLHIAIFAMESIFWMTPQIRASFGIESDAQAEATKPLAYNQGFYNLFLAVGALLGVVLVVIDRETQGWTLVVFCCASMVAAALVLTTTGKQYLGSGVKQGTVPALALVAALIARLS